MFRFRDTRRSAGAPQAAHRSVHRAAPGRHPVSMAAVAALVLAGGAGGRAGALVRTARSGPAAPAADTTGAVAGVAYDSVAGAPLAGAAVQIASAGEGGERRVYNVRADTAGRYRADALAPGVYVVAVAHPVLDSLGLDAPLRRVRVAGGTTTPLDVGLPGPRQIVREVCPARAVNDSAALLVGFVRDGATGTARGGATVTLAWTEVSLGSDGVRAERTTASVTTAPSGWFCVCNPPTDVELLVHAAGDGAASGEFPLELAPGRVARRDIHLGDTPPAAVASAPEVPNTPARGSARLRGTVRGVGGPVANALVGVAGTAARAVTGADGAFVLADLPVGTRALDVRAVGYLPVRTAVDVRPVAPGQPDDGVTVTLHERAAVLDTVRVRAERLADPELAGFARRRKAGGGLFLDRAALERRNAVNLSDALVALPGVWGTGGAVTTTPGRVALPQPGGSGRTILLRLAGGELCTPVVWLDNVRLPAEDLDWYALPADVVGVEVYPRGAQAPARFQDLGGCGAIVVWTDRRR
jgi:hypothetical protein